MDRLKDKFREKAVPLAAEIKDIIKNHRYLKTVAACPKVKLFDKSV